MGRAVPKSLGKEGGQGPVIADRCRKTSGIETTRRPGRMRSPAVGAYPAKRKPARAAAVL